jgi:hypothetical protein
VTGKLKVGGETGGGGTLIVNRGEVHVTGDIVVGANGTIQGVGTLSATGQILASGFISPGLSPGTLTLDSDLVVDATGVVFAEVAGKAPAQQDHLVVTGTATLGGKLVLQFMNGFAPHTGDHFDLLTVGGAVTGGFATIETAGLEPGALLESAMVGGVLTATAVNDGVALPTVSLKNAGKSKKAFEKRHKSSTLRISRTGDRTAALSVNYAINGTAENGVDYVLLSGTVTIPAGKSSVTLKVEPIDDALTEGTETIELKIVAGTGYTNSLKSKAAVTLVDDERVRR